MKKALIYFSWLLIGAGCSLDIPYDNQFSDPDAITTSTTGRELLASAYSALPNPGLDLAILSDDFVSTYWASRDPSIQNQYNWQPTAFHSLAQNLWPQYYEVVVRSNALLERLPDITISSAADLEEVTSLEAEARTLKAYCYFQLLRLFAPIPSEGLERDGIILKDQVLMANLPRASVGQSLDEIRSELNIAINLGSTVSNRAWLTTDASTVLLAEVELYAGNYDKASQLADGILQKYGYDTFGPSIYRNLWDSTTCDEQIFIFDSPTRSQFYYNSIQYDANMGDYFALSTTIADSFESTDCRTEWTVVPYTSQTLGSVSFIGKYNLLRRNKREVSFVNKIRLSHALFTAVEAWCLSGQDTKAVEALNNFLSQRGSSTINTALGGNALMQEILWQKQKEFVGEGERYFDLKMYRNLLTLPSRIPQVDDYRWLWPLPREEYLYNDNASQNPGWPREVFNE